MHQNTGWTIFGCTVAVSIFGLATVATIANNDRAAREIEAKAEAARVCVEHGGAWTNVNHYAGIGGTWVTMMGCLRGEAA